MKTAGKYGKEIHRMKKISLPMQILIALIGGIIAGLICFFAGVPEFTTNYLKPFGTIFVNLLKFIVVPVVLLSMIDGILYGNNSSRRGYRPCDCKPV